MRETTKLSRHFVVLKVKWTESSFVHSRHNSRPIDAKLVMQVILEWGYRIPQSDPSKASPNSSTTRILQKPHLRILWTNRSRDRRQTSWAGPPQRPLHRSFSSLVSSVHERRPAMCKKVVNVNISFHNTKNGNFRRPSRLNQKSLILYFLRAHPAHIGAVPHQIRSRLPTFLGLPVVYVSTQAK